MTEFTTDWFLFYLIPALIFISVAGSAVLKSKLNKQNIWYIILTINFSLGLIFAMGAAIPLGAVYLIFFQKPSKA